MYIYVFSCLQSDSQCGSDSSTMGDVDEELQEAINDLTFVVRDEDIEAIDDIIKKLGNSAADFITSPDLNGWTAFSLAADIGNLELIQKFIKVSEIKE